MGSRNPRSDRPTDFPFQSLNIELIPKLNIASLNFKFLMINRVSDHGNGYETLFYVKTKIGFRMSSKSKTHFETVQIDLPRPAQKVPPAANK